MKYAYLPIALSLFLGEKEENWDCPGNIKASDF
jgi:hypothetical protein